MGGSSIHYDKNQLQRLVSCMDQELLEGEDEMNTLIQRKEDILSKSRSFLDKPGNETKLLKPEKDNEFKITQDLLKERLQKSPYSMAIKNLRKVREYETPIDKMRCITQTSKCIVALIDAFWRDIPLIDKQKLTLDADQLLMLFIFVTLRSKVAEILAHLKLINEFSTDSLRHSKLGYYSSTLEVAI